MSPALLPLPLPPLLLLLPPWPPPLLLPLPLPTAGGVPVRSPLAAPPTDGRAYAARLRVVRVPRPLRGGAEIRSWMPPTKGCDAKEVAASSIRQAPPNDLFVGSAGGTANKEAGGKTVGKGEGGCFILL